MVEGVTPPGPGAARTVGRGRDRDADPPGSRRREVGAPAGRTGGEGRRGCGASISTSVTKKVYSGRCFAYTGWEVLGFSRMVSTDEAS